MTGRSVKKICKLARLGYQHRKAKGGEEMRKVNLKRGAALLLSGLMVFSIPWVSVNAQGSTEESTGTYEIAAPEEQGDSTSTLNGQTSVTGGGSGRRRAGARRV